MLIRKGNITDTAELQNLFANTILSVCKRDYNDDQLQVWSSGTDKKERWLQVLEKQYVLVAVIDNVITGFCTMDKGNHIDFLFVHKDYLRQRIANRLYSKIEQEAIRQKQTHLTADVSKTARPFFETMGFKVIKEQIATVEGIDFINYKMKKILI